MKRYLLATVAATTFLIGLIYTVHGVEDGSYQEFESALKSLIGSDSLKAADNFRKSKFMQVVDLSDQSRLGKYRAPLKKFSSADSTATPVVQMHGMGDWANDPFGMVPLAEDISEYLGGAYVLNVQIGDNSLEDILNGFIMNLDDQVDYFAEVVAGDAQLQQGFNAVGYSQGNLVIRGYIERYNNPPVLNFISMHGPLAGVGGFPGCDIDGAFCRAFAELLGVLAYRPNIQQHLAQANYYRDPLRIPAYLGGDIFLADVNNEHKTETNDLYNSNWAQLNSVCLVKAEGDTVVVPNDSEWFGSFQDGTYDAVWDFAETPWYKDDLFGLRALDEAGKVYFNTTAGNHLDFSTDYLLDLVGIYFV